MQIHQDVVSPPPRRRQVSFQNNFSDTKKPLTPHNRNLVRKPTPHKAKTQTPTQTMTDKENTTASFRRSIRSSTASPFSVNKKNEDNRNNSTGSIASTEKGSKDKKQDRKTSESDAPKSIVKTPSSLKQPTFQQAVATATSPLLTSPLLSPLSSVLRRSMLSTRNHLGPPQRNSLLQTEMEEQDHDMSLLTSPSAMGNPNALVSSPPLAPADSQPLPTITNQNSVAEEPVESKESSPRQQLKMKQQEPPEEPQFKIRGNGVEMDLTEIFSGFESPKSKQSKQPRVHSSLMPTVFTDNLREGVFLDFDDDNLVGKPRSLPFMIQSDQHFELEIERIPFVKGINFVVEDPTSSLLKGLTPSNNKKLGGPVVPNVLTIHRGQAVKCWVTWTPVEEGGMRETILLKLPRGPGRLRITLLGHAKAPPKQQTKKTRFAKTPAPRTVSKSQAMSAARDHFTPARIATPSAFSSKSSPAAPMVSAIKVKDKISIPEDWAERQCSVFTEWLNYMFQPTEDLDHELILREIENGKAGVQQMDRAALRTLVVHQRLAQARTRALQVFHTDGMKAAQTAIVAEIARGRLMLRCDRDVHADLTLRGKVIGLLLSYSTQWLRIGLEVMFGQPICAEQPSKVVAVQKEKPPAVNKSQPMSRMKIALKNFIISRVLSDSETLRKYTMGRCNVPSGKFEKKYRDEMRTLILTRLLVLVVFLDKAKMANILDRVPRLFTNESKVKSTRDVLVSFCRDFLSSEGDIIKHLSRIGVKLAYKQEPIDELDFKVSNLAVDIRDGVRLARMTEILSGSEPKSLLVTLRLPAVSRLQKLHNVGVVLDILTNCGLSHGEEIAPHHIVDGYREQVLRLLWAIVAHWGLNAVLDCDVLRREIDKVVSANRTRSVSWKLYEAGSHHPLESHFVDEGPDDERQVKILLLQWCNAITSLFGIHIQDFTSSFADGVALCLLIHYYHPGLLRLGEIMPTSRHGARNQKGLENERCNFALASERMTELGGIPKLLQMSDSSHPPEEKSMFLCLVYLCARLMESSSEVLASISIQSWYRRKKRIYLMKLKIRATKKIWKTWREQRENYCTSRRIKYGRSVKIIEQFVLANKPRLKVLRRIRLRGQERERCATLIQAHVRRRQSQLRVLPLLECNAAVNVLQRFWRRTKFLHYLEERSMQKASAVAIQTAWRGHFAYGEFSAVLWGVIRMQATFRGVRVRNGALRESTAAIQIQRIWRGFMCQVQLQMDMLDIITIQSVARRLLAKRRLRTESAAVLTIQDFFRLVLAKKTLEKKKEQSLLELHRQQAARTIQRIIYSHVVRIKVCKKQSSMIIQSIFRCWYARRRFLKSKFSAIVIQSIMRGYLCRSQTMGLSSSAIALQTIWRRYTIRKLFKRSRSSAIKIQASIRRTLIVLFLQHLNSSACLIQASVRRWMAHQKAEIIRMKVKALQRAELERNSAIRVQAVVRKLQCIVRVRAIREVQREVAMRRMWSAIVIQTIFRTCFTSVLHRKLGMDRLERLKQESIIVMQRSARRYLTVRKTNSIIAARHHAATRIQSLWRCFSSKQIFRAQIRACRVFQRHARGVAARESYERKLVSIIIIQSSWRMSLAHKSYNVATHAVLVIQSIARIVKAKSRARVRADALVKIQAFFRKCIVTSRLKRENAAAIAIQRRWWCFLAFLQYQSDLIDIVIVQSIFRAKIAMGVTAKRLEAVVTLQTAARRWIAVMRAKARLAQLVAQVQLLTGSALIIQKAFRSSHARIEDRKHKAAIQIQKTWRCFSVHVDYMLAILAAMAIQRFARNFLHQLSIERAAPGIISFQALYRGYRERKSTACLLDALATIQSLFRSVLVRKELSLQHSAAITIQRIVRGILDRLDLEIQEFAATEIQKVWRGFFDREEFLFHIVMILRIQSSARRYLSSVAVTELKRKVVMETISRKISARRIQMAYRHYINLVRLENHSIILQSFARGHLARIKAQRVKLGAIALQACVRGHAARSRRTKLEVAVCRRIARATHRARKNPGLVLGVRTKLALQELRTSKRLTEIMVAAKILETSTRLSRNCCVAFAECGAPEILYELIGTCNRSLPHIEILQYVLLTLRNVSCHHDLVGSVATSKSVEILLDLVQMFRDKSEVFQVSVILLDRVVRNNGELQKSCGRSENLKRLNHVLRKVSLSAPEGTSRSTRSSTFGRRQSVKVLQNLLCFLKD